MASAARRVPPLATTVVVAAMLTMLYLASWQWERSAEKAALIARFETNRAVPGLIELPAVRPVPDAALFRTARATCAEVTGRRVIGGRSAKGVAGMRAIAECGGPNGAFLIDLGVADDPSTAEGARPPRDVVGPVVPDPQQPGLAGRLMGQSADRPMIVLAAAPDGLSPSEPPAPGDVPNNHLAYAGQWLLFALAAGVIYALALRRRWRDAA